MYLLSLEASTTSAKAMLYDTLKGETQIHIRPYGSMYEDQSLHSADHIFECMMKVGRELSAGKDVQMISLGGTWHSVLLCGPDGRPLTPVYPWTYTGAAGICRRLREDREYTERFYKKTGCMVNATYPFFKLLELKDKGYRLSDCLIMGQGTYHNYRLTGERVTTACMASGSGLMNIHTKSYDPDILKEAGITEENLSRIVPYDRTFPLAEEGAKLLGLKSGIPVIPSNADGGLNQLGVGAMKEGIMTFSAGTSGALRLTTKEPVLPADGGTWCYLSPKGYLSGAATAGCCNCIDWFRKKMGGGMSYEELEQMDEERKAPPIFLPFLYGERCPGWDDRRSGGFVGIKPWHDTKDLYLGVQQGILFHLYQCYEILTGVSGRPDTVKLSGGILNSRRWTKMCADIFGRELVRDEEAQGSLKGGIVLAQELLGLPDEIFTGAAGTNGSGKPDRLVYPDLKRKDYYKEQYRRYLDAYEMTREKTNEI